MATRGRVGPNGPTPTDTDDELLQALRNLWPILSPDGRRQAITEAERATAKRDDEHPLD